VLISTAVAFQKLSKRNISQLPVSSELQFRVLRLLESNPHLTQRELSKSLGVSLGGVNYCLNALVAKGSVKIQNFKNNKNKWVYAYLLTPQGIAEKTSLTGAFLKRKMQEYQKLKEEIEILSNEINTEDILLKDAVVEDVKAGVNQSL
jgi:EPS-associated MarR family transcriptional regulator